VKFNILRPVCGSVVFQNDGPLVGLVGKGFNQVNRRVLELGFIGKILFGFLIFNYLFWFFFFFLVFLLLENSYKIFPYLFQSLLNIRTLLLFLIIILFGVFDLYKIVVMLGYFFTLLTNIKIRTSETLVSGSYNWFGLAFIACNVIMNL
jgi:hypothetical protein